MKYNICQPNRRILGIFLFILLCTKTNAQIDNCEYGRSLIDSAEIILYSEPVRAYPLIQKGLAQSNLCYDLEYMAKATGDLATYHMMEGNFDSSDIYIRHSNELRNLHGNMELKAGGLALSGTLEARRKEYCKAENYLMESLHLYQNSESPWMAFYSLEEMGYLMYAQGNNKDAEDLFCQALDIAIQYKKLDLIDQIQWSLAILEHENGNYEKSLEFFRNLIINLNLSRESLSHQDSLTLARSYQNVGGVFLSYGTLDSAKLNLKKALKFEKQIGDSTNIGTTLANLGNCFPENPDSAKIYFLESEYYLAKFGWQEELLETIISRGKIEIDKGSLDEAKKCLKLIDAQIGKNIQREHQKEIIDFKYDIVFAENKITETQLKRGLAVTIFLLLVGFIIFQRRNFIRKQKDQLEKVRLKIQMSEDKKKLRTQIQEIRDAHQAQISEQTETILMETTKTIHDILGSEFSLIISKVKKGDVENILEELTDHYRKIRNINKHLEDLKFVLSDLSNIEEQVAKVLQGVPHEFFVHVESHINFQIREHLFRSVFVLCANSLEYADPKFISCQIIEISDKNIVELHFEDRGNGFDTNDLKNSTGLGIKGIQERTEKLNGIFNMSSLKGEGTVCLVTIPLP